MLPTSINRNTSCEGETIEQKVRRIVNNKEPIKDATALIYTERKDGVVAAYDIRTDIMEIAVEKMEAVQQAKVAERKKRIDDLGKEAKEGMDKEAGGQSTDATGGETTK